MNNVDEIIDIINISDSFKQLDTIMNAYAKTIVEADSVSAEKIETARDIKIQELRNGG